MSDSLTSFEQNVLNSLSIDASYKIFGPRLGDMLCGFHIPEQEEAPSDPQSVDEYLERFHHFSTPSLPHLLALLTHRSSSFPPSETSLIVVDSISTLFAIAFPRTGENASTQQPAAKKSDAAQWASGRRWAVMGDFIFKIGRFAATRNIAILLTSQMTTRVGSESGAVLYPAISGNAWDTGISTRIVIFRDWISQATDAASSQGEYVPGVRLAGVIKAKGVSCEGVGKVVMFTIETVNASDRVMKALLKETEWPSGNPCRPNRDQTERTVSCASYINEAQTRRSCR